MAKQTINNGETGFNIRKKINDNFTENYDQYNNHVAGNSDNHGSDDIINQSSQPGDKITDAIDSIAGVVQNIQATDSNAGIGVYSVNAFGTNTLTVTHASLTYFAGLKANMTVENDNTGAVTVNFNSLGAKNIKKIMQGVKINLSTKDLKQGEKAIIEYDGTDFILLNHQYYNIVEELYCSNSVLAQQVRQHQRLLADFEGEINNVTLTNSLAYPFNNSKVTINLSESRDAVNYTVVIEIVSSVGEVGEIKITDKAINGFKIEFTGSATSVVIKYYVQGGMYQ